jgi:hypothetical protein
MAWPLTGATWLVFQGERIVDNARIVLGQGE